MRFSPEALERAVEPEPGDNAWFEAPANLFERELGLFRQRLISPRTAVERPILSPEEWLVDPYYSGGLGQYDPITRTGCWPETRKTFLEITSRPNMWEVGLTGAFGTGKAELVSNRLPTPSGFRAVGDLRPGDFVFGADGRPTRVTGVFPRGCLPAYRVVFSDGAEVVVSEDHLWAVGAPTRWQQGRFSVRVTKDLLDDYRRPSGQRKCFIPLVQPLQWPERDLPVDPYVLGVWLADGSATPRTARFCCGDEEVPQEVARCLPPGVRLDRHEVAGKAATWHITADGKTNPITTALRVLGLDGKRSWERFIPEAYLTAGPEQRLSLVQGLMDTDGETTSSSMTFGSTSIRLLEGFRFLVESLGGVARQQKVKKPWYVHEGERREGRPYYRCSVSLPRGMPGARVLAHRWPEHPKYGPSRCIRAVEAVGDQEVVCISVEAPDGLYVTEHCIVTHNTDTAIRLIVYWLYMLSCYADPQALMGLQAHSVLAFILINTNRIKAERKLYKPVRAAIRRAPYFQECFPWDTKVESHFRFPKNIEVWCGVTDPETIRGEDPVVVVVDECNFLDVIAKSHRDKEGMVFDAAEEIYEAARRRQQSRFLGVSLWAPKIVLLSSRDRPHDFLERRELEIREGAEIVGDLDDQMVINTTKQSIYFTKALWRAVPAERYDDRTFRVEVGGDNRRSRILDAAEIASNEARTVLVPEDFRAVFEANVDKALRELAGIAVAGVGRLIPSDVAVESVFVLDPGYSHPFTRVETSLVDGGELLPDVICRAGRPICCPGRWRFGHIDVGLTQDCLGLAVLHVHTVKEVLRLSQDPDKRGQTVPVLQPVFRVDLVLRVVPPRNGEIRLGNVEALVYQLQEAGVRFGYISTDSFQCLAAGTWINTDKGLIPIEEVQQGDVVESRRGPAAVLGVARYEAAPTIRIETKDGDVLEGTPNHRIEVARQDALRETTGILSFIPGLQEDQRWEWRRLDEVRLGDVVHVIDRAVRVDAVEDTLLEGSIEDFTSHRMWNIPLDAWVPPGRMNTSLAEWLGLIWGDGNINHGNSQGVTLTVTEDEAADAAAVFVRLFGFSPRWVAYPDRECGLIRLNSKPLVTWMLRNGLVKPLIPEKVLRSSRATKAAFLRGLFAADGSVSRLYGGVSLSTKHYALARQVQVLLRTEFGLQSNIAVAHRGYPGDYVLTGEQYVLAVRGSREAFASRIGFTYQRKQALLAQYLAVPGRSLYSRVVTLSTSTADVYDLTVEGDPSYVANGFVSHNSVSLKQSFLVRGIASDKVSMDRTPEHYLALRDAVEEGRVECYPYPPLREEMRSLIFYRNLGKVDHPPRGCFTGETRVALANGTCPTFKELVDRPDVPIYVYSIGSEGVEIVEACSPRITKYVTEIVEILLDNYHVIRCTPDHLFMTLDKDWVRAEALLPDVRLMPLYRTANQKGGWADYEYVWCPVRERRILGHHVAIPGVPAGSVVRHRDGDKRNNDPRNLEVLIRSAHRQHHGNELWAGKAAKMRAGFDRYFADPSNREVSRQRILQTFAAGKLKREREVCAVEGCFDVVGDRGLCGRHYQQARRKHALPPRRTAQQRNHNVLDVRRVLVAQEPVYDLTVPGYENFALAAGVFVHNSKDCVDSVAGALAMAHRWDFAGARQGQEVRLTVLGDTVHQHGDFRFL